MINIRSAATMKSKSCPNPEVLRQFVHCNMTTQESEQIGEHVETCSACEATVSEIERHGDTVAEHIRQAAAAPTFSHEPECRLLLDSLLHGTFAVPSTSQAVSPDLEVDQLRWDYRIVAKIGQGGMGTVYRAVHQHLKRPVALKVLPAHWLKDPQAIARFKREMEVLGQLDNPHIVRALDAGDQDGQHYLVMEYVDGWDLSELLRRHGPLTIPDACHLISQAAEGLQYAHEHGVLHRDIKPSNLMLTTTGHRAGESRPIVKILDLGLARALEQPEATSPLAAELTSTGQVMGTIDYMAPEQGGDAHQVDIRADIYSLGVTLYKLLTGESPYAKHNQLPPLQRMMAIAQQEPAAIRTIRPEVPARLAAIVHRMMTKNPRTRFATPAEVVQALEPFCRDSDLAKLLLAPGDVGRDRPQSQFAPMQKARPAGHGVARRWRTAWAGLAGFVLLAAILMITTRHGTVEVSSPEGKLPDDVKVVVSRGGEEVEILQADNQWSAKIVSGEYQVQLRGGEDRFEIKNSKLTISRLGRVAITVALRQPDSNSGKNIAATIADDLAREKSSAGQPEAESWVAPDWSRVARIPAEVIPDQEKPFVVINQAEQAVGEYKFITEVLPILKSNEILEIRGNGPFKLPQIVRDKEALHIRAGEGYRPKFIADFATPDDRQNDWFRLNEVEFSVEGCDFIGSSAERFFLFVGNGEWLLQGCRFIGQTTHTGGLFGFSGRKLVIRNSLLTSLSAYYSIDLGGGTEVELHNNIVCMAATAFNLKLGTGSSLTLRSNLFYRTQLFSFYDLTGNNPLSVIAEDNLFVTPYAALCQVKPGLPVGSLFNWKGTRNRVVQFQPGALFESGLPADKANPLPQTVKDWNTYWKNDTDLRQLSRVVFKWDYLALNDWTAGAGCFKEEIAAARRAFPALPQLGPEMELIGARPVADAARQRIDEQPRVDRPQALEGGPFVILRNGEPVAGYLSLAAALEKTKTGDIIEVRSDGVLRTGLLTSPKDQHLTLRAGTGYSPVFMQLWLTGGDWTLEGLRFQPETLTDALACSARRVANCTFGDGGVNSEFYLLAPEGIDGAAEVLNCYLAQGLVFDGPAINVRNSVVRSISFKREASFTANKSCFWNHSTPIRSSIACIGQSGSGNVDIHLTDCLIDSDYVLAVASATCTGERNLFRIHGNWGTIAIPGQPARACWSLGEWRDFWKSDTDSQFDESALLRSELWRQE